MDNDAQAVLDFWFGAPGSPQYGTQRSVWFRKDAGFDASIAKAFGALIERTLEGELRDWDSRPTSVLARILLLDQFTRNVFRDTPRAFAGDSLALAAARSMVAAQHDQALAPLQRGFVYLPLEHSEDLAMQDESVRLFTRLATDAAGFDEMLDYARRHRDVIARFGRFPHRNAILGLASSEAERGFLSRPGSRF